MSVPCCTENLPVTKIARKQITESTHQLTSARGQAIEVMIAASVVYLSVSCTALWLRLLMIVCERDAASMIRLRMGSRKLQIVSTRTKSKHNFSFTLPSRFGSKRPLERLIHKPTTSVPRLKTSDTMRTHSVLILKPPVVSSKCLPQVRPRLSLVGECHLNRCACHNPAPRGAEERFKSASVREQGSRQKHIQSHCRCHGCEREKHDTNLVAKTTRTKRGTEGPATNRHPFEP